MSANTWLVIAIVGFSLAGAALIAAVVLFIRLNIPAIIGDLTGRTVAREIKALRDMNASGGDKRFRPSAVNLARGKLTEEVMEEAAKNKGVAHASKRLDRTSGELEQEPQRRRSGTMGLSDAARDGSEKIGFEPTEYLDSDATEVLSDSDATEVLEPEDAAQPEENATEVLEPEDTAQPEDNATEVLEPEDAAQPDPNATEVLTGETELLSGSTTVLTPTEQLTGAPTRQVTFKLKLDEVVIHSDETIE